MQTLAIGLLIAAMGIGAVMAWRHATGRAVPALAGIGHAFVAVSAVIALATVVFSGPTPPTVNSALLLATFALIGGGFNAIFRWQGERPPGFMILLHALAAAVALTLLLIAAFAD